MKYLIGVGIGIAVTIPFGVMAYNAFTADTIGALDNGTSIQRFQDKDNPNVICYVVNHSQSIYLSIPAISCLNLPQKPYTYQ